MLAVIRRRPFVAYYLLALLIALGVMAAFYAMLLRDSGVAQILPGLFPWLAAHNYYVNLVGILRYAAAVHPAASLILLFAVAPSLSAIIISWLTLGGGGVRGLLRKYLPSPGGAARGRVWPAYAAITVLYVLGLAAYALTLRFLGAPGDLARAAATLGGSPAGIAASLAIGPFLDEGGALEELGWRGFALPVLQRHFRNPLRANLVLGALWMAWHLPRELPSLLGGIDIGVWLMQQGQFLVLTLALSVIAAWLVNRTGGSVLPAIMLHGGSNVWSKALGAAPLGFDLRTAIVVPIAIAIAIFAGKRLGLSQADYEALAHEQ